MKDPFQAYAWFWNAFFQLLKPVLLYHFVAHPFSQLKNWKKWWGISRDNPGTKEPYGEESEQIPFPSPICQARYFLYSVVAVWCLFVDSYNGCSKTGFTAHLKAGKFSLTWQYRDMIDRHFITFLAFLLTIVSGECFFFMKYFIFYEHLGAFRVCLGNFFGKLVKISVSREKGKKFHYCEWLIRLMIHQKSDFSMI